jgi:hypothetical protein
MVIKEVTRGEKWVNLRAILHIEELHNLFSSQVLYILAEKKYYGNSKSLLRRCSVITITILDIIHRPVFYLKVNVSETGFCLRLQTALIQVGQKIEISPEPNRRQRLVLYILGPTE